MKIKESYILVIFPGLGQDMLKKLLIAKKIKVLSLNVVNRKNPGQFINIEGSKTAASEAIDAARSGKFDVILVDSVLPVKYENSAVIVPNTVDNAVKLLGSPFDKMTEEIAEAINQFKKEGLQSKIFQSDSLEMTDKLALEYLAPVLAGLSEKEQNTNTKDEDKTGPRDARPPKKNLFMAAPLGVADAKTEKAKEEEELAAIGDEDE